MSRRWYPFRSCTVLAMTLVVTAGFGLPALNAQTPKPDPAPPPTAEEKPSSSPQGPEYDEEVARVREDLENLQLWLAAKRAQLKAAELSSQIEQQIKGDYDRLAEKKVTHPIRREIAGLELLESEAQQALIRAEIGDLQAKYHRTRRYLTRLEQYGTAAMKAPDDRSLEIAELQTRLKSAEQHIIKLQEQLKDARMDLEGVIRKQR
jgi:hypothetical protein